MSSPLTVALDDKVLLALDRLDEETDRPRDWLVEQAIETYVAGSAWQIERIRRGLAEADAGDFAGAKEMERIRSKFTFFSFG